MDIICNIHISNYQQRDKLIWFPTTKGEFLVKSAYHLEKECQDRKKREGPNQARSQAIWKIIWGLKVPNSTKVFLWRACNNILPAKDNLKKRRVIDDDRCIFCCQERETIHRIIWACPLAQDVWSTSNQKFQKSRWNGDNFLGLFEEVAEALNGEILSLFVVTTKEIWQC